MPQPSTVMVCVIQWLFFRVLFVCTNQPSTCEFLCDIAFYRYDLCDTNLYTNASFSVSFTCLFYSIGLNMVLNTFLLQGFWGDLINLSLNSAKLLKGHTLFIYLIVSSVTVEDRFLSEWCVSQDLLELAHSFSDNLAKFTNNCVLYFLLYYLQCITFWAHLSGNTCQKYCAPDRFALIRRMQISSILSAHPQYTGC